jgi:elongator complex protein 3
MSLTEKIILAALENPPKTEEAFNVLKRSLMAGENPEINLPDKTELLVAYHDLVKNNKILPNEHLERMLMRRAVRSLSGVAVITSLIKPYPCPGQCVYCPFDERMPKSYLSEEPAAMRALMLEFNPYEQMARRIEALQNNGHPADKIEFIVKGGTWNSYTLQYQYWFILKSFEACNTLGQENAVISTLTEDSPLAEIKAELARQQTINETAKHRIIGLTLETRPDCINYHTIWQMREMGCTRIELGIQHTDDAILELTKRGHGSKEAMRSMELLRNYGFKVDAHLMPQLPGATPDADLKMMQTIFSDPGYKPDMIKIYPCTVVKNSELYDWFVQGKYKAYSVEELIDILVKFKTTIPYYARISRLIRDIPGQYIEEGNTVTNLRQVVQLRLKKLGTPCRCLRCREVGHVDLTKIPDLTPHLFVDEYDTHGGTEYFLSFEDKDRTVVFAFCRLRIVDFASSELPKEAIRYPAYIRELHTYGKLLNIGVKDDSQSQHKGLGKKLLEKAETIAQEKGVEKLAVISGVGVRDYYRKWGYELENTYMIKNLPA